MFVVKRVINIGLHVTGPERDLVRRPRPRTAEDGDGRPWKGGELILSSKTGNYVSYFFFYSLDMVFEYLISVAAGPLSTWLYGDGPAWSPTQGAKLLSSLAISFLQSVLSQ